MQVRSASVAQAFRPEGFSKSRNSWIKIRRNYQYGEADCNR
jgi:hypothetical protein